MEPSPAPKTTNSEARTNEIPDGLLRLSLPGEQWRSGPELDWRYYASTAGRLASVAYRAQMGRVGIIQPGPDAKGYLRTVFFLGGKYSTVKVHRIVAAVWIGPIAAGMTVHHRNFNPADNRVENLEIVTLKENIRASARAGRYGQSKGSINGNAKLTEAQVAEIRRRWVPRRVFQKDLAKEFGVCRKTIREVIHKGWRHVA